jgi:hypothetical protein
VRSRTYREALIIATNKKGLYHKTFHDFATSGRHFLKPGKYNEISSGKILCSAVGMVLQAD